MAVTPDALRQAMGRFATGVTVILSELDGQVHGMTANAVTSVSLEPPLLLVCVGHQRRMHGVLERTGAFSVNILAEDQEAISRYYAGDRQALGEDQIRLGRSPDGSLPILADGLAWLACRVVATYPGGDHTIFLARIDDAAWRDGRPLLFFRSRYARLREG